MTRRILPFLVFPALALTACTGAGDDVGDTGESQTGETSSEAGTETGGEPQLAGIPILGDTTHDIANLDVTVISSAADGLAFPTDLEFKPGVAGELWVTNREDFSIVVYQDAGLSSQLALKLQNEFDNGAHFLAKPAALAFGAPGTFATAQQENGVTQPGDPLDGSFMGPTMWTSDLNIFTGGHQSHLDMLHNSPLASGIDWEDDNTYWVYDGTHGSLTRYKFNDDHGLGGTDHTDGEIYRYANGELGYEHSIPSHVVFDRSTAYVYAADTENGRIVRLDPTTASMGNQINPNYDGCVMNRMDDGELITLVDGAELEVEMTSPSGLELVDGVLFVSDPIQGRVFGFDLDGELLDWLDTGYPPGSLMGMAFDSQGDMWIADAAANQVRRFSVPE
ncbi:hypothetical protein [Enhygromyxa salina]|nr:hypothetical protein [Enhygromyxa salina]